MNAVTIKPMTNKQRSKDARKTRAFKDKMLDNSVASNEFAFKMCRRTFEHSRQLLDWAIAPTCSPKYRIHWIGRYIVERKEYIRHVRSLKSPYYDTVMPLPN